MTAPRASTSPLYVGGFRGPFGSGVPAVLIPRAAGRVRRHDGRALCGRAAGDLVDRFGRVPVTEVGALAFALLVGAVGPAPGPVALAALWFAAGVASALLWAGINTLVVEAVPENRAGGTSVTSAFKFAGSAAAPVMWLPLYHADPRLAFLGAGAMALLSGLLVLPLRSVE